MAYFGGRLIGGPKLWPRDLAGQDLVGLARRRRASRPCSGSSSPRSRRRAASRPCRCSGSALVDLGVVAGRRPLRIADEAAVRRQGFQPSHSWPWGLDGSARRLHRGRGLRGGRRPGRAPRGHGSRRACSVVSSTRATILTQESRGERRRRRAPNASCCSAPPARSADPAPASFSTIPARFQVEAVAGGRDGAALARTAIELGAKFAAIADPSGYADLKAGLAGRGIEVGCGAEAMEAAARWPADLVVAAIVGAVGLEPTFAAIEAGRTIALANKETLVCAGAPVMRAVKTLRRDAAAARLRAQRDLPGARRPPTRRKSRVMTITASGGPFRDWSAERIASATRAEALAHPKWAMGPKIIDRLREPDEQGPRTDRGASPVRDSRRTSSPWSCIRSRSCTGSSPSPTARPSRASPIPTCARRSPIASPIPTASRAASGARPHRAVEADVRSGRPRALSGAAHRARGAGGGGRARRPRSTPPTRSPSRRSSTAESPSARLPGIVERTLDAMRAAGETRHARRHRARRWRFTISREIGPPPSWPERRRCGIVTK